MLYPDLRRLSLRSPATGVTADGPPSRKSKRLEPPEAPTAMQPEGETPQQAVLRQEELLQLILFGLVDDDDVDSTCAKAVTWCDLAKPNQGACDADVWKELTRRVFPNLRVPSDVATQLAGQSPEVVTEMHKKWFVYFCKDNKKLRDLKNALASQTRAIAEQYTGGDRAWLMLKADSMDLEVEIETLQKIRRHQFEALPMNLRQAVSNRLINLGEERDELDGPMLRYDHAGAKLSLLMARAMHQDEWKQLLRKIKLQETHIRSFEQLPQGTRGPQTLEELLEKERLNALDRLIYEDDRHQASYAQWLRDREQHYPWERHLNALVEEARALIEQNPRVPLNILDDLASALNIVDMGRRAAYPFQDDYRTWDMTSNLESRIGQLRKWLEKYPGRAGK